MMINNFLKTAILCFVLVSLQIASEEASSFSFCSSENLNSVIEAHNDAIFRLHNKFDNIWYFQGEVPKNITKRVGLKDIQNYLSKFDGRNPAVLVFAQDSDSLCSWLIEANGIPVYSDSPLGDQYFKGLQAKLIAAMGVRSLESNRVPQPRTFHPTLTRPASPGELEYLTNEASKVLFQEKIVEAIKKQEIDALIVVPIGLWLSIGNPEKERDRRKARELVAAIGTMPLSTFMVGCQALIDRTSIVIAPGFHIFAEEPKKVSRVFRNAIIVGDPRNEGDPDWKFPELPGAREEAEKIADMLNSDALIGHQATKKELVSRIKQNSKDTNFIHLATHGISDEANPLDGSFLMMSEDDRDLKGRLSAREISQSFRGEHRLTNRPLVVLSACDTGLGKNFDVGTIGLARAWLWVGAAQVVMSLWNVDDKMTKLLMTRFIELAKEIPTDLALQKAMQEVRNKNKNPAYWAGFTIFGEL